LGNIRQINGVYYIEFYARGLLYSQVAGQSLEEAQRLLSQVEEKIAGGEALTITRYIDLPDFFERFLSQARGERSPKTVGRFSSVIKHFSSFLKSDFSQVTQLSQITPAVLESYKAYLVKTQKPKMANFTVLLIREILEFGIKLGFINDNPSLHLRLLPWSRAAQRRSTPRHELAKQLLSKGIGLAKCAQLMGLTDMARLMYFADLIPLNWQDRHD
jgi:site-specific recombinase XerD